MKPLFLLADDNDAKRDFLQRMILKNMDCEILVATTEEEAISLINQHVEIPFAFIDYNMPVGNGPVIIAHLLSQNPQSHIALVTSADSAEYEQRATSAGAEKYICTSWALDRVEREINMLLAEWNAQL